MATFVSLTKNKPLYCYVRRYLSTSSRSKLPAAAVTLDQSTEQALEAGTFKPRQHKGRLTSGCISVPEPISSAILRCCKDHPVKALLAEGNKLDNFLRSRKAPLENDELRRKINDLRHSVGDEFKGKRDVTAMSQEQITYINTVIEAQAKKRAKQQIYAWNPISYDQFKSLQYLLGRSAAEYATLIRVFDEIKQRDAQFKPRSFIDFGSGVGTGTWAVSKLWKEHIFEYVSIDASADMNDLAELILRGGELNKAMSLRNVFYRQFLPASHNKYDIVLSSFSLFELPSKKNRLDVIENLWNKCDGYLVLVEQGSFAGFSLIEEAREFLLKKIESSEVEYHIFSPCPHHKQCPRMKLDDGTPCNFEVKYNSLPFGNTSETSKFLYSYVVFKKGTPPAESRHPRLVRPTLVRSKHSICRMCTDRGQLQEIIFTASKHGKNLYHCARASKWGDQLPITIDNLE